MTSEDRLPTFRDVHAVLVELIERGLGDLPVQVVVCPDSTMQALARDAGAKDDDKPALLIEFDGKDGRHPVTVLSTARLSHSGAARTAVQ